MEYGILEAYYTVVGIKIISLRTLEESRLRSFNQLTKDFFFIYDYQLKLTDFLARACCLSIF